MPPFAKAMGGEVVPIPEVRDIKSLGNNPGATVLTTVSRLLSPDLFCSPDPGQTGISEVEETSILSPTEWCLPGCY